MNRRDFIKGAFSMAFLAAAAGIDAGERKTSNGRGNIRTDALQVTRRKFKDIELPLLSMGMMRLPASGRGIDYGEAKKLVARAMASGMNYFDTAYMYHGGESENFTGEALSSYPRDSFFLATKMPLGRVGREGDLQRIFDEQLKKCRVDYFDFYLAHNVNGGTFGKLGKFKIREFMEKMKKAGKIRYAGFSFHDSPEMLERVISDYGPWDFVQLQINYLDWISPYRSREQYETACRHSLPVIVMEPLRGGSLVNIGSRAKAVLKKASPECSPAAWGLRYAASLPNVATVLSGMGRMDHLEENIETFSPFRALTENERAALDESVKEYRRSAVIPCTGCNYCISECPMKINISGIFAMVNDSAAMRDRQSLMKKYSELKPSERADVCISCRRCVPQCPQHIDIPKELKKISADIKKYSGGKRR